MHNLGLAGKTVGFSGHPVVEAHTDTDEQIALGRAHVGPVGAVHADHAEPERIGPGESSQPHE